MDQEEAWSDDFFKEILIRPLMEMHDKATDIAMKERKETPFKIVHKDEDRQPEEYPIDPDHLRKFLYRRVSQTEKIIDNHVEALFDDANDDPSEKLEFLPVMKWKSLSSLTLRSVTSSKTRKKD